MEIAWFKTYLVTSHDIRIKDALKNAQKCVQLFIHLLDSFVARTYCAAIVQICTVRYHI